MTKFFFNFRETSSKRPLKLLTSFLLSFGSSIYREPVGHLSVHDRQAWMTSRTAVCERERRQPSTSIARAFRLYFAMLQHS